MRSARRLALAERLAADAPGPVKVLNLGGGFGIPYFKGDVPLDLTPIGENLRRVVVERSKESLPHAELVIELGRYLVGEAGLYVCRVLDRKVSRGEVFLVTDGGLHHHLAASGNFGQVIRKNYPVVIGNHVRGEQREVASVVGPLCTPLDVLADRVELGRAEEGDSGRCVSVGRLWLHGESAQLPGASASFGGPGLIACPDFEGRKLRSRSESVGVAWRTNEPASQGKHRDGPDRSRQTMAKRRRRMLQRRAARRMPERQLIRNV